MTTTGRTIKIFLMEGDYNGILTAEVINWTGKIIVFNCDQMASPNHKEFLLQEVERAGAYFLVGDTDDNQGQRQVYIGESENVYLRLTQHQKSPDKGFWTRTIVVVSKDDNLTKSHIKYLEANLIQIAKKSRRASLSNGAEPNPPSLPSSDKSDMEFFVEQTLLVLSTLGFDFSIPLTPMENTQPQLIKEGEEFQFKTGDVSATARVYDGKFLVLANSTAALREGASLNKYYCMLRKTLKDEGVLVEKQGVLKFSRDYQFDTASKAATIIAGTNRNGRDVWKHNSDSKTSYNDWIAENVSKPSSDEGFATEEATVDIQDGDGGSGAEEGNHA